MAIRKTALAFAATIITALGAAPVQSQMDSSIWRAYEQKIKPAVFCIRKTALYEVPFYSPIDGELTTGFIEKRSHGSGVNFESIERDGRREYRILTNNHVVEAPRNSNGGRLVRVTYALVENSDDQDPKDDIIAQRDIRNPDQDQAILVTVGAPELPVADIARLGSAALQQGDQLLTTGFPSAVSKTSVDGTVSATEYDDPGVLPFPGKVYAANIPIDAGQSGSPVLRPIKTQKGDTEFELIGLIYAKNPSSDQVRLITPIGEQSQTFSTSKDIPSKRPSLERAVDEETLQLLSEDRAGITSFYNINEYKAVVRPTSDPCEYLIRHFRELGDVILQNEMLDFRIQLRPAGGISVTGIVSTKDGVVDAREVPADMQQLIDKYANAVVNHFQVQLDLAKNVSITASTPEQTRFTDYVRSVVKDQADALTMDAWGIYSQLYEEGVISKQFW